MKSLSVSARSYSPKGRVRAAFTLLAVNLDLAEGPWGMPVTWFLARLGPQGSARRARLRRPGCPVVSFEYGGLGEGDFRLKTLAVAPCW